MKYVKRNFLPGRDFIDDVDFKEQLVEWEIEIADQRVHGTTHERPIDRFAREREHLVPLAGQPPYRLEARLPRIVAEDYLVSVDTNRYSVPFALIGQAVEVARRDGQIEIFHRGNLVIRHAELSIIVARLSRAAHILDHFLIVQWVNEALTQLRGRLFSGTPKGKLGRTFKVKKWLLLSARARLKQKEKRLLAALMERNEPLYKAYLLKEQLRAILNYPWKYIGAMRTRLQKWMVEALGAGLEEFERVSVRLAEHIDAVIAGHQHDVPLGLAESVNSKIAVLRFQARGYSDPEYFKLKIFQRCSLTDNPWARIIL